MFPATINLGHPRYYIVKLAHLLIGNVNMQEVNTVFGIGL